MNEDRNLPAPPDVVHAVPVDNGDAAAAEAEVAQETITEPAKLLRIASMVRELLDETRQATIDEPGRKRLADIYARSVGELSEVLSDDLRDELQQLAPPVEGLPSESELRIAQAQLVGWLEGLFHGIQAAMFAQQAAARAQFEELRRRGLLAPQNPKPGEEEEGAPHRGGQYL
ncbi:MAG TPA: proteasome activator [Actinomycetota bacterium]